MKKLGKILLWTMLALVVVLALAITFTIGWRPFIGPRARALTGRKFESTPERLARGQYLVNGVAGCMDCHAPHDWNQHDAPMVAGQIGAGQDFGAMLKGLPGSVIAPNISSDPEFGAGNWTDDQLARAIREGVGHDGRALFPLMPYPHYAQISDEDLASIIVYIRTLPPVHKQQPPTQIIFPVKYLIRTVPQPIESPVPQPDLSTPEKRGAYLINMGGCSDCHTPQDNQGQPLPGMEFAGGQVFAFPAPLADSVPHGQVASANLTPDPSGIPYYDNGLFVQTMRTGYVKARSLNPVMPWHIYRNMTDEDLGAIFAYLKTLKPIHHRVDNSLPPTYCKIVRQSHGGDLN